MEAIGLTRGMFALVDESDLERVSCGSWCASPNGKTWFAMRAVSANGRVRNQSMHRLIMDAPKGMVVYHINGHGLDNRRSNLRLCTRSEVRLATSFARPSRKLRAVVSAMAEIDDRQGYATVKEIIFQSGGVSERTIRTYLKELVDSGEWVKLPPAIMKNRPRGGQPMRITRAYRDEAQ